MLVIVLGTRDSGLGIRTRAELASATSITYTKHERLSRPDSPVTSLDGLPAIVFDLVSKREAHRESPQETRPVCQRSDAEHLGERLTEIGK